MGNLECFCSLSRSDSIEPKNIITKKLSLISTHDIESCSSIKQKISLEDFVIIKVTLRFRKLEKATKEKSTSYNPNPPKPPSRWKKYPNNSLTQCSKKLKVHAWRRRKKHSDLPQPPLHCHAALQLLNPAGLLFHPRLRPRRGTLQPNSHPADWRVSSRDLRCPNRAGAGVSPHHPPNRLQRPQTRKSLDRLGRQPQAGGLWQLKIDHGGQKPQRHAGIPSPGNDPESSSRGAGRLMGARLCHIWDAGRAPALPVIEPGSSVQENPLWWACLWPPVLKGGHTPHSIPSPKKGKGSF